MKKILSLVLTVCMLCSFVTVYAVDEAITVDAKVNLKTENGVISQEIAVKVDTKGALANTKCGLLILRPEGTSSTGNEYIDKYAAMYQAYTDANGVWEITFPFADESGDYQLQVVVNGAKSISPQTLYIPSITMLNDLMQQLENKETSGITGESLLATVKTESKYIGLDVTVLEALPEALQTAVCQDVIDKLDTYTIEALIKQFDLSVICKGMTGNSRNAVKVKLLSHYETYLKLTENALYSYYDNMTAAKKESVAETFVGADITTIDGLKEKFFEELFVAAVQNVSVYTEISGIAEDFKAQLDITDAVDSAAALSNRQENLVYKEVMKNRKKIASAADFASYVKDAVDNIDKLDADNTSSNTSSGNSGIGGGTSSITMPSSINKGTVPDVLEEYSASFTDLGNVAWAAEAINALAEQKIVSGKTSAAFCPEDPITRSEFVKLISELFGYTDEAASCSFTDVPEDFWGYRYIASAAASGVVQGKSQDVFGAEELITREDIATIIYRAYTKLGRNIQSITIKNEFTDFDTVSAYAKNAVVMLQKLELISGYEDQTFRPQENATRAETAVIIYNVFKLLETM